jgi:hypothetical protein
MGHAENVEGVFEILMGGDHPRSVCQALALIIDSCPSAIDSRTNRFTLQENRHTGTLEAFQNDSLLLNEISTDRFFLPWVPMRQQQKHDLHDT